MLPLSAVIITYNEQKNIARCIDSLQGIVDDIVVIDSFSTDETEKICKTKGVRFIQHLFEGHIEQKNWAITQAQFPHVLSLDADESLDETLKKSILEIKNNWHCDGYYMNRLNNYCGKWIYHGGWYPDRKLRLWNTQKGKWGGENPHDKYELFDGDKKAGYLQGNILHYSFYTIEQHQRQVNYFTDIASKAMYKRGKRATVFNLIFNPFIKFIRDYFLKFGFLDGYYGFAIAKISAKATYLKYAKLKNLSGKD